MGESGQVTAFVVGVVVALVAMAGLVIDGGYALAAKSRAFDAAYGAARAGAQALAPNQFRAQRSVALEPGRARAVAQGFLARSGHRGEVEVVGDRVRVVVQVRQPMTVLRLVGLGELVVAGQGEARAVLGTREPGP